jgi:hypothetical protein
MSGRDLQKARISLLRKVNRAIVLIFPGVFLFVGLITAQDRSRKEVQYTLIPMVTVDDRKTIDFFVEEFFLPETDYSRIEVIDTESNGFGKSDLIKFYPSGSMYYLDMVTDTAQKVMNSWEIEENLEIVSDIRAPGDYDTVQTAEYGILSSLAKGIERNYKDSPINISVKRDSTGIIFEMWGFNADSLQLSEVDTVFLDKDER